MTPIIRFSGPGPHCRYTWQGHVCGRDARYGDHTHRCPCGAEAHSPHAYTPAPGALGLLCWCGLPVDDALHQEASTR